MPKSVSGRAVTWRRWIDTYLDCPHDITDWRHAPPIPGHSYGAQAHSVVVLLADA